MEVSVKRGIKIVLFFLVILIASACGMDPMDLDHLSSQRADTESGLYETVKLSIENGASHVRSDVSIEIKFPRSLQRGAGNEKNIFLLDIADVESSTSSDERGGLFAGICDLKLSVPAAVSTYDRINFAIRPYDELKEGAVYALCILDSIVYQDGDTFRNGCEFSHDASKARKNSDDIPFGRRGGRVGIACDKNCIRRHGRSVHPRR